MAQKAPGKAFRKGISLIEIMEMFPDDDTARKWFEDCFWPDGRAFCNSCGSVNVQSGAKHPTMTHRCRDCKKFFSVKSGTAMHGSKLGYRVWAIAIYLLCTNLKGVSSMKLHRDLNITQKSAWHLAHRLRKSWEGIPQFFNGPVEFDETYIGGKEGNKKPSKKLKAGRGPVGKTAVIGAKDRETNRIEATAINDVKGRTLRKFVRETASVEATVYTDENQGYSGIPQLHETVKHSVGEYVQGQAHTNGIESFWAMLKRGYHGTYHKMSKKHLSRYVREFSGRHNLRPFDTKDQMAAVAYDLNGKRLSYKDLTKPELKRSEGGLVLI